MSTPPIPTPGPVGDWSPYTGRPWLNQYPAGLPSTISPEHGTMLALFESWIARSPTDIAIKYFDGAISVAELERRSNALAMTLQQNGFAPGDRFALFVQNNPAFVVGLLAAWKLGGSAVLINPMNKQRELSYLLADSGATALLCLDDLYASIAHDVIARDPGQLATVISCSALDDQTRCDPRLFRAAARPALAAPFELAQIEREYDGSLPHRAAIGPDDVAVLMYTSGTTGQPKATLNTHRAMSFNSQTYRDWMHLTPADSILGVAPLFHITGLVGHVGASLMAQCPLILHNRFQAEVVVDAIREHHPTFTVAAIAALTNLSEVSGVGPADFASLRAVYSGGAAIAPATVAMIRARTGLSVHNIYGLTETNSPSHAVPLGAIAPVDPRSGALSVGLPVFNTMSRILASDGQEAAVGSEGEIAIAGPQVVPGYWRRPEASAETFIDGELRTGDVGVMDADGWFYVVDRLKDMINAAGYKVWPREVEDVLHSHPSVREAAVVGVPDEYRGETVKAFVALVPGAIVTEAELVDYCRSTMAAYKYPRVVEFVDQLPRSPAGKVLRRMLRPDGLT